MDERTVRRLVHEATTAFGIDATGLVPLGGATGQVLGDDEVVLRLGWSGVLDHEQRAAEAASTAVPVPALLDRYDSSSGDEAVMLLRRAPGTDAGALEGLSVDRARRRGAACGGAQLALGTVSAPRGFTVVDGWAHARLPRGADAPGAVAETRPVLLHLDLHPLNIMLGEDDEVTAVIDWTNASSGPADLDRARSASILHLDPHTVVLRDEPLWRAFVEGWTVAARLDTVPPDATAWACRAMLDDLAGRHTPDELAHVQDALVVAEAGQATGPESVSLSRPRPAG